MGSRLMNSDVLNAFSRCISPLVLMPLRLRVLDHLKDAQLASARKFIHGCQRTTRRENAVVTKGGGVDLRW